MAVPVKQPIRINFAKGLDRKTDPWQTSPESFLALNNMVFTVGEELSKRNGFAGLGKTINTPNPSLTYSNIQPSISSARKIFTYNDELLINDPHNLYSYDSASNSWVYKGRSTMVSVATSHIVQGINTNTACDVCIDTTNNVKVFVNSDATNSVHYSIQDTTTGQIILNQALFDAASIYGNPKCFTKSGKSYVFAVNSSDFKLYYQEIDGQTVSGPIIAIVTDLNHAHPNYQIGVDPLSGNTYLAYYTQAGNTYVALLNSGLGITNAITKGGEVASNGIDFFGDGTNIWVVYNNSAATKGFIVNNAVTTTILAPTIIDNGATAANVNNVTGVYLSAGNNAVIFYDQLTTSGGLTLTAAINYNTLTVGGAVGTPGLFIGSLNINSKAFAINSIAHLVGSYTYKSIINGAGTIVQPTTFLLNLYNVTPTMGSGAGSDVTANIAAKISQDEASASAPVVGHLANVSINSAGAYEMALLQNSNFAFTTAVVPFASPTGVIDCQFDFSLTNPDVQTLGNNAIISAGSVLMYDGASVVEQNFHIYPNALGSTVGAAGSIATAVDAVYSYIYLYEWIDNQGQVHRSFPSPVVTPLAVGHTYTFAAATANGSVSLTIPYLRVTNKQGTNIVINIYRTTANGSVYYLTGTGTYGSLSNDISSNTTTFVDVTPDATIINHIQLYTTGALGYFAPDASSSLTTFKNRAISIPSETNTTFSYSNQAQQNFPVQFVPEFIQNIGSIGGPITAISQMDDKLIIFKSGKIPGPSILYMVGQGPAPSGANNDFTDPLPVAVDVGCVDRQSIVMTPVGLMFKSDKGIYLLDRGLKASYLGAPVEFYNQYSVISSQLIPNTTQVRFMLSNGTMLMYDYFYGQWGTFSGLVGISDCIFEGQHTFVDSTGQVYKETPGTYVDLTNTPITMSFTTSWIKLAGLQGYQRSYFFFLLAKFISSHNLQLQIYYDFSSTVSQTTSITPDSSNSLENWRVFLANQRCQSFQLVLTEIPTGTPGAGFTMSGINLIMGIKSGFTTISAAQSAG